MTAVYNLRKKEEQTLARFSKSPPSFTVHLHAGYWTLNKDNSARNFLYTSPAASILESIRAHRVPVDMLEMFDQANVPFYDGCLIVEEHDHTSAESAPDPPSNPGKLKSSSSQVKRIVLYPNGETLWADISLMNVRNGGMWTDQQAIEFEAKVLALTAPPLCLDPNPVASRIAADAMSSASFDSAKRKHSALENDKRDDGTRKAERDKFMNVMNPRSTRIFHADFRQQGFLEQRRRGERAPSPPPRSPSPQPSLAPTPTPPPASAPTPIPLADETSSSHKKKSKKKKTDSADSPMQIDAPSPGFNSKSKPRKNSITQASAPQLNGKKKHGQNNRRGTASSVEPSPANLVMQLPPNAQGHSMDSPHSMQASPSSATAKREDQSALGIGVPPLSEQSPAPTYQQLVSVGGPPKKRMKTETPAMGSVPLPGGGSQHGTPQQSQIALAPNMSAPVQQPTPAPRYSASPAPVPGALPGQQSHPQYPGQLQYNYGNLGMNFANGMMVNNGTGQPSHPGYNPLQGLQQPQAPNMHANLLAAQNQQQAAARAGSPHSLPPSRPASQAGVIRNSPRPTAPLTLGPNGVSNLQPPQPDPQSVRPGSAPGQHGVPQPNGMQQPQNPMHMQMDQSMQMAVFQQMQAQRMISSAPNMMQYPNFGMQMPGQPGWRMAAPGQMPMGVGRGQPNISLQYAAAAALQQRRNAAAAAMQAPANPQR